MSDEERIRETEEFLRATAEEDSKQQEARHKRASPPDESGQKSKKKKGGAAKRHKDEESEDPADKDERPDKKTKLDDQIRALDGKRNRQDEKIKKLCNQLQAMKEQEAANKKVDVVEMYSVPKVTEEAQKNGSVPGLAMDLKTGWNFNKSEDREVARKYQKEAKPLVIIGSPMCRMFSQLQNMTPWTTERIRMYEEDVEHVKFMIELYTVQVREGRYFIHEHPVGASSWRLEEMVRLLEMEGVETVIGDQCMFGLKTWGKGGEVPTKKPTRFATNADAVKLELAVRCDKNHVHQRLANNRAKGAEQYPKRLCAAICRGIIKQKRNDGMHIKPIAGIQMGKLLRLSPKLPDPEQFHDKEEREISGQLAWDDLTGMKLETDKVKEARQKEIQYIKEKEVWVKIPRAQARAMGIKVIGTKWIDVNKGDDENPNCRSRFVAKEFNNTQMDGLFAVTPPLEAMRYLVHQAATVDEKGRVGEKAIMINDVARAFFEA